MRLFAARYTLSLALSCLAVGAIACCVVSNGARVQLADEKVIIVWDTARKTQHFVRQARFDTKTKDFGFIVPTPSVPKLALADANAYSRLERLIPLPRSTDRAGAAGGTTGGESKGVEVISTEKVGDYQATIVKATDGKAMNGWLKENGYTSRPAMEEWLDYYAKQQWVFTAFKFLKNEPTGAWTQAIRLSFQTDRPRYPYKMPTDTWPEGWRRPLNVYFIAPSEIESKYVGSDKHWEARVKWSGALPTSEHAGLAEELKLTTEDLPRDAVVTIFENSQNPKGYDHDLYFAFAPQSSSVAPLIGGGVAAVFALIYANLRRRRTLIL